METGADANLSKREQQTMGWILYLLVLACWVSAALSMPLVGAFVAGLLTAVLFYTVRNRVRRELSEHHRMVYEGAKAEGARRAAPVDPWGHSRSHPWG